MPPSGRNTPRRRFTVRGRRWSRWERRRLAYARNGGPPLRVRGIQGRVQDVSRFGVSLVQAPSLRTGDSYHLVLEDALDRTTCGLQAEVVWSHGDRAGLRWVGVTTDQDFWLLERFQAWMARYYRPGEGE